MDVDELLERLRTGGSGTRAEAVEALLGEDDHRVQPALVNALSDPDPWVRKSAAAVIVHRVDESAVPALIEALSDTSADVRADSAIALGKVGDRGQGQLLIELLWDQEPGVRAGAAEALGRLREQEAVPMLHDFANVDPHELVRFHAEVALVRLGIDHGMPTVMKHFRSENETFYGEASRFMNELLIESFDRNVFEDNQS